MRRCRVGRGDLLRVRPGNGQPQPAERELAIAAEVPAVEELDGGRIDTLTAVAFKLVIETQNASNGKAAARHQTAGV